jgi:hypothetical protein
MVVMNIVRTYCGVNVSNRAIDGSEKAGAIAAAEFEEAEIRGKGAAVSLVRAAGGQPMRGNK